MDTGITISAMHSLSAVPLISQDVRTRPPARMQVDTGITISAMHSLNAGRTILVHARTRVPAVVPVATGMADNVTLIVVDSVPLTGSVLLLQVLRLIFIIYAITIPLICLLPLEAIPITIW